MMSKNAVIFHIANLHTAADHGEWGHSRWLDTIRADFRQLVRQASQARNYLVIAGDITSAGRPEEFSRAQNIVHELCDAAEVDPRRLIIVPGNHDRHWEREGRAQLHAYYEFSSTMSAGTYSVDSSVRAFPEDRLVFLLFDTTMHGTTGRIRRGDIRSMTRELEAVRPQDDVLVAVLHHGLDATRSHHVARNAQLQQFLDEWSVDLVLHAGEHAPGWTAIENGFGRRLQISAGTVSPEVWRSAAESRHYQVIVVRPDRSVEVNTRVFHPLSEEWTVHPSTPVSRELTVPTPARPRVVPQLRVRTKVPRPTRTALVEQLNALPPQLLLELVSALEPAIRSFSPRAEPQVVFVQRLVEHFENSGRLDVLGEAVRRYVPSSTPGPMCVFVSAASPDRQVARELAEAIRNHGYSVWFDEWRLVSGDSLSEQIVDGMARSDALVVVLSDTPSMGVGMELQMWADRHGPAGLVVVCVGKGDPSRILSGHLGEVHYVELDRTGAEGSQRVLRAVAGALAQRGALGMSRTAVNRKSSSV